MGKLDQHLSVGAQRVNMRDWGWLCAQCQSPRSGHCLYSRGGRFPGRSSAFEVVRSDGVGMGNLLASGLLFFPITGGSFVCSKAGREGRRERVFCPTRMQQL